MIIVLKPETTPAQIEHVIERIQQLGLKPHVSTGEHRTIIGVIGDENKLQAQPLEAIAGVEKVLPIMKPFKMASREFHKADTVVQVGKIKIGGGSLGMIAGPCIESGDFRRSLVAGESRREYPARRRFSARRARTAFSSARRRRFCAMSATSTTCRSPRSWIRGRFRSSKYAAFQISARTCRISSAQRSAKPVAGVDETRQATVKDDVGGVCAIGRQSNVVLCERGVRSFGIDATCSMMRCRT